MLSYSVAQCLFVWMSISNSFHDLYSRIVGPFPIRSNSSVCDHCTVSYLVSFIIPVCVQIYMSYLCHIVSYSAVLLQLPAGACSFVWSLNFVVCGSRYMHAH